jgi:hypothetical protein
MFYSFWVCPGQYSVPRNSKKPKMKQTGVGLIHVPLPFGFVKAYSLISPFLPAQTMARIVHSSCE